MITSENKEHGFYWTFKSYGVIVDNLAAKMFDLAGQTIKDIFKCTDEEAAAVLDSRIGRHLADVVSQTDNPTNLRVKVSYWMSKGDWMREAKAYLQSYRKEREEREEMGESNKTIAKLLEASESILSLKERRLLNNAIHKEPVLGGNQKVRRLGEALNVLSRVLSDNGFVLDMVPGDLLLGPKGNRTLTFRRALPPGSDAFDEGTEIESRISFNWEDLNASNSPRMQTGEKSYEVVVYLT